MEAFRRFLKGWFGKVLLFIFLAPLALFGISSYFTSSADTDIAASVDDVNITQSELSQSITMLSDQIGSQLGEDQTINTAVVSKLALKSLVDRTVLRLQGMELGLGLSDVQITSMLRQDPSLTNPDGTFSAANFETLLRNNGMSKAALFERIRQDSASQAINSLIQLTSFTTDGRLERFNKLSQQPRGLWLKQYDWREYADQVAPTDAQLSAFYESNKEQYVAGEQADVDYMVLKLSDFNKVSISEQELTAAYQARVDEIKAQSVNRVSHILFEGQDAINQAQKVRAQIMAGESFAEAAQRYSTDIVSQDNGGDLGAITQGAMPVEFEEAVKELDLGEVSEPVTTEFGVHLIKLTGQESAQVPSFQTLRSELASELMSVESQNAFQNRVNEINEQAATSDSLLELANQFELKPESINAYPKARALSALPGSIKSPDVAQAIFDPYNIDSQAISMGINTAPDQVVWVQPLNHRSARQLNLEEAKLTVRANFVKDQALKLATQAAKSDLAGVKAPSQLSSSGFTDLGEVTRSSQQLDPKVVSKAFALDLSKGVQTAIVNTPNLVTAIVVQKSNEPLAPIDAQQSRALKQYLARNNGQLELSDYTAYARKQFEIKTNDTAPVEPNSSIQ
jgi:peptidyl-prolyl cis-trans isomerase D